MASTRKRSLSVASSESSIDHDSMSSPPQHLNKAVCTEENDWLQCSLPPTCSRKPVSFPSSEAYESHYHSQHINICHECHKNFPSPRYLDLHITENHDTLAEARRARGEKTYGCFIEDCHKICSTSKSRRWHLIDKHMFPKEYRFSVVNTGVQEYTSMLRRARTRKEGESMEIDKQKKDLMVTDVKELTKDMAGIKLVPLNIQFGRKGGKAGFRV